MVVSPLSLSALTDSWGFELPEESQTHRQTEIAKSAEPASEEAAEASEWGSWGLKTASGDFFSEEPDYVGSGWPQTQQPRRENGDGSYDTASDVRNGPNVYTYVVQNPWTKFDPLGLYDNETLEDLAEGVIGKIDEIINPKENGSSDQENESNVANFVSESQRILKLTSELTAQISEYQEQKQIRELIDSRISSSGLSDFQKNLATRMLARGCSKRSNKNL